MVSTMMRLATSESSSLSSSPGHVFISDDVFVVFESGRASETSWYRFLLVEVIPQSLASTSSFQTIRALIYTIRGRDGTKLHIEPFRSEVFTRHDFTQAYRGGQTTRSLIYSDSMLGRCT